MTSRQASPLWSGKSRLEDDRSAGKSALVGRVTHTGDSGACCECQASFANASLPEQVRLGACGVGGSASGLNAPAARANFPFSIVCPDSARQVERVGAPKLKHNARHRQGLVEGRGPEMHV